LVGAPGELSRVADVHGYFRRLAEASPRVEVRTLGESEEGREILLAVITDAQSLRNLERYREIARRLADPRETTRREMESLVQEGKMIYYLLGGLHSPETGSPEMLMELAYRLAVSERPEIRAIRENLVVLVTPVCEPDGRNRMVDWYYRHLRDRELPYEELRKFGSPPYWGHYVFHDNNRDGMQLTLALTRAVHGAYYEFHPQIVHDLHESLPLLYISTGHGPYSRAIDPVTINEWTQFAHHEASELQAQGLPGVWVWGFWDGWWPGYLFSVANNHNSMGRFYETFGNAMAGTFERNLEERKFVGKPVTKEQWYRPWPPDKKVNWSLRNNTNYMQAGVLEALHYAALHRAELLRNFWVKGERAVEKGRTEAPYAWIFPAEQRDRSRLAYLVNLLQKHRFDVHQLDHSFEAGDATYPAGSYVIRMDQPYRSAIYNFLEEQKFPSDEPNPPYDDVAWTWPLLFGVEGSRIDDEAVLEAPMSRVRGPVRFAGKVLGGASGPGAGRRSARGGSGRTWLLRDTGQTALLAARVRLGRASVEAAEEAFEIDGETYPAGSWIVRAARERIEDVASELGLDFIEVEHVPDAPHHAVDLPRLAVLHTWTATQDCGWVRYTLDGEGISYTLINPDDLKRGRLDDRFDVILFPNTWGEFKRIVHGIDPAFGPLAYTKTSEFPSHGSPNSSDDITGGMGFTGLLHLEDFVHSGGVLVALGNAGTLPVDGGVVRRVNKASVGRTPGSEIRAKLLKPEHPIGYGCEELTSVFRGSLPLFDVHDRDRDLVVLQFGTKEVGKDDEEPVAAGEAGGTEKGDAAGGGDSSGKDGSGESERAEKEGGDQKDAEKRSPADAGLVLSGFVKEPGKLDGKPAILDVPVGDGRVVLFSFNPLHRHLNLSDFRLVYNVLLNWNDLPAADGAAAETIRAVSRRQSRRRR
ncbi:MAG: M14 family zinc carboxypeptidase, partial [Candidatus Krumholzibacteriia bacterium]